MSSLNVQLGSPLTSREVEVLALAAEGLSIAEIGRELWLSAEGVRSHLKRAYRRLGAAGRSDAVALAQQSGQLAGRPQ